MDENNLEQYLKEDNSSNTVQARINPDGSVSDEVESHRDFVIKPIFNSSGRINKEDSDEVKEDKGEVLEEIVIEEKPTSNVVVQSRINPDGTVGDFDPVAGDFTLKQRISNTGRVIEDENVKSDDNSNKDELLEEIVIEEKPVSGVVVQSRINPDGSVREDISLDENTVIHAVVNSTGRVDNNNSNDNESIEE